MFARGRCPKRRCRVLLALIDSDRWWYKLLCWNSHKRAFRILPLQNVEDWVDVEGLQSPLLCQGGLIMADLSMLVWALDTLLIGMGATNVESVIVEPDVGFCRRATFRQTWKKCLSEVPRPKCSTRTSIERLVSPVVAVPS